MAKSGSEHACNITFAHNAITDIVAGTHEKNMKYIFRRMGEIDNTDKIVKMPG